MNYIWAGMILTGLVYGILTGHIDAVSDAVLDSSKEAVTLCVTMLGVMGLWMGLMEIAKDAGLVRSISRRIQPLIRFLFPNIPEGHTANEHITMNFVANFLGLGWAATPAGLKAMESLAKLEEERRATEKEQVSDGYQMEDESASAQKKEDRYARRTAAERQIANAVQMPGRYRMEDESAAARQQTESGIECETGHRRSKAFRVHRLTGIASMGRKQKISIVPCGVASNEMCTFLILNISSLQLIPVNVIAYRAQYGSVNPTAIVGPGIAATAVSTLVAVAFCKVVDKMQDSIKLDKIN